MVLAGRSIDEGPAVPNADRNKMETVAVFSVDCCTCAFFHMLLSFDEWILQKIGAFLEIILTNNNIDDIIK